jgi:NTE family protein
MARVGLVLGAGGAVGGAFHAGVLAALSEGVGFDAREARVIVGTSAGAMTGALLRAGIPAPDLARRASGEPLSAEGRAVAARLGPLPSPPSLASFRPGPMADPAAFLRQMLRPFGARPGALAATALPEGRTSTEGIEKLLEPLFGAGWCERPLWLCALRLRDARRVVFGRDALPDLSVARAVAASCAIPGLFRPVRVEGERYVDGGAHSVTNADVLRDEELDLVIVSAPLSMARAQADAGFDVPLRALVRVGLRRELAGLRARGIELLVLEPDAEVRAAMGPDPLDPARRTPVAEAARARVMRRLEGDLGARLGRALAG